MKPCASRAESELLCRCSSAACKEPNSKVLTNTNVNRVSVACPQVPNEQLLLMYILMAAPGFGIGVIFNVFVGNTIVSFLEMSPPSVTNF